MGDRILTHMQALGYDNHAHFAEQMVGVSRQTFHAWLYKDIDPEKVAAAPILRCAELLSTNAEYLLCVIDDFRPETALTIDEAHLIQAYRSLTEQDRARLMKNAADWLAESSTAPSAAAPFRIAPLPKAGR